MSARDNQAQGNRPAGWNPLANKNPGSRPAISGRATNASRQPAAPVRSANSFGVGPAGPVGPTSNWLTNALNRGRNQVAGFVDAVVTMPNGGLDLGDPNGPSGPSGPSYAAPAPLRLPRMAMPSPESLAAQLYAAVGAATSPYQQAIGQLAGQQVSAQAGIKQADQTAGMSMNQATRDWRAATGQISGQIADVYRTALSSLAGFVGGNNAAMMNAGFAPSNTGGNEAYARLAGLGASAQEASLARRDMGEAAVRGDRNARSQITQAGTQSLAASYAQVLGGLNLQKAAAEAAARAEQVNRQFALQQEIDRINFDAASQEAAANR